MRRTKPGLVIDERYLLRDEIGGGGVATVWLATDLDDGLTVALKLLHPRLRASPNALSRMHREARVLRDLDHPNIARARTIELERAQPYFVMELVEGVALDEELGRRSAIDQHFDEATLGALFNDIVSALTYAHRAGVVHRDLKPSNVMLTADGVKVLDFGLARLIETEDDATTHGRVVGTRSYMSPEQADGTPADARADVFAIGVILFEALTLRRAWVLDASGGHPRAFDGPIPPVSANTPIEVLARIRGEARPRPATIREGLDVVWDEVVAKATAVDRAARYASAEAIGTAIADALCLGLPAAEAVEAAAPDTATPVAVPTRIERPPSVTPTPSPAVTESLFAPAVVVTPVRRGVPTWTVPLVFLAGLGTGAVLLSRPNAAPTPLVDPSPAARQRPGVTRRAAPQPQPQPDPTPAPSRTVVTRPPPTPRSPAVPAPPEPFAALENRLAECRRTGVGHDQLGDEIARAASNIADPAVRTRVRRLAALGAFDGDADGLDRALALLKRTIAEAP